MAEITFNIDDSSLEKLANMSTQLNVSLNDVLKMLVKYSKYLPAFKLNELTNEQSSDYMREIQIADEIVSALKNENVQSEYAHNLSSSCVNVTNAAKNLENTVNDDELMHVCEIEIKIREQIKHA